MCEGCVIRKYGKAKINWAGLSNGDDIQSD
jgi:hypothetical protein